MTPFDPVALVVMLETFYPVVLRAALERAFRERPEYFAGGTLIGRHLDALKLPDGRIFDIVFAAWTSISRWQALDVTHAEDGPVDPFALEEGPLVPVDIDGVLPPPGDPVFLPLVGAALVELGASDIQLEDAEARIAAASDPAGLDAEYADTIAPAAASLEADALELEGLDVVALLEQSDGLEATTDDYAGDYSDDSDAPDAPPVDGPGDPPIDEPPPPQV